MPEIFDQREVTRLLEDAAALVEEAACDDGLVDRLLVEAELAGARAARDVLVRSVEERKDYYLSISGLWVMMAEGVKGSDMAKVRGAHAGLRAVAMRGLSRDPLGRALNNRYFEEEA